MTYIHSLSKGFLVTIPNTVKGKYFSYNKLEATVLFGDRWEEFSILRINKCRHCKKFFVMKNKKEIFFKKTLTPIFANIVSCAECKIDNSAFDNPDEEYGVPVLSSTNSSLNDLLKSY
jgi:hypothetical protein